MKASVRTVVMAWLATLPLVLGGCYTPPSQPRDQAKSQPPPTFTGPTFLHGTVGSLTKVAGYEPLLVSGYGLVVNLSGTGSADVPAFLHDWLITEMRKKGMGESRVHARDLTPNRVLASNTAAVVAIEGLIPPGAVKGTTFDVLVSALPQTQTTSLKGGQLWTADLSIDGLNESLRFSRPLANARGPMYLSSLDETTSDPEQERRMQRQAVVLSGGVVRENRRLQLTLNTASWTYARLISDRLNERFDPVNRKVAVPRNDVVIDVNIPRAYGNDPQRLLGLLSHLYLHRGPGFEAQQAQRLGVVLTQQPEHAGRIALAWEALGKTALPVIREYYNHAEPAVRLAALEAGARLEDDAAVDPLKALSADTDPARRRQAAALLAYLPRNLRGSETLQNLLNDKDRSVRIAAYESLADYNDPVIQRHIIGEREKFKFVLDLVPAEEPLIYINQTRQPRLAIFNPNTGFHMPLLAMLFGDRLMIKAKNPTAPVDVFYQAPGQVEGRVYQIAPTVANLAFLMGHYVNDDNPTPGLDLSFTHVVQALHALAQAKQIEAPIELVSSPMAQSLSQHKQDAPLRQRPEIEAVPAPPAPAAAVPPASPQVQQ